MNFKPEVWVKKIDKWSLNIPTPKYFWTELDSSNRDKKLLPILKFAAWIFSMDNISEDCKLAILSNNVDERDKYNVWNHVRTKSSTKMFAAYFRHNHIPSLRLRKVAISPECAQLKKKLLGL